jgi:hypothetical protein
MKMSNRLPVLAVEIRRAHADVQEASTTIAVRALAAGTALLEAKSLCAHGKWGTWLKTTGISDRTAQRYMSLPRSGCVPNFMERYGLVRAAEFAALGLKLYPAKGRSKISYFHTHDRGLGWTCWWWRSAGSDEVVFTGIILSPVWARALFVKEPLPVFLLGLIHAELRSYYEVTGEKNVAERRAKRDIEKMFAAGKPTDKTTLRPVHDGFQQAKDARLECGRLLTKKKTALAADEWLPWLKANESVLGFSDNTACQLMDAAQAFDSETARTL